ncbi:MarR family winged helix-turn-helix transcriptional regulator [Nocardia acidivorans]|uniref:MarR family winged helix-turn-helix transcriptional regulator n=1 Tax=Nocardia acidivorans TaxID=404580 RepID=UPI000A0787BC|nr:MarR family transcriptional regulator [Nocardia acidivorans]
MTESREYHPKGLLRYPTYALGKLHKAVHNGLGTSLREHWVLTYLSEFSEITQQEMADALNIDRSEVVRLVDSLEKSGLVTRTRDPEDRRKYRLAITNSGRKLRDETNAQIATATDALLFRLTPAERTTLHRLSLKALGYDLDEL